MTITIQAVYASGVLCPVQPLRLAEGETVEITIRAAARPPTPQHSANQEEAYRQRALAAQTLEELYAVMATGSPLPDEYDLSQSLNANRKATGEGGHGQRSNRLT